MTPDREMEKASQIAWAHYEAENCTRDGIMELSSAIAAALRDAYRRGWNEAVKQAHEDICYSPAVGRDDRAAILAILDFLKKPEAP